MTAACRGELAELDHPHCGGGDDGLRDRGEAEDGVGRHRPSRFAVGQAVGLDVRELAILHYGDDGADDALLLDGGLDGGVDSLGELGHGPTIIGARRVGNRHDRAFATRASRACRFFGQGKTSPYVRRLI